MSLLHPRRLRNMTYLGFVPHQVPSIWDTSSIITHSDESNSKSVLKAVERRRDDGRETSQVCLALALQRVE